MNKPHFFCWVEIDTHMPPDWLLKLAATQDMGFAEDSGVIELINKTMGGFGWLILRYPYHDVFEVVKPLYLEYLSSIQKEKNQIILFSSVWLRYVKTINCMILDTSPTLHDERIPPHVRPYAQERSRRNSLYKAQETLGLGIEQILDLSDHASDEEKLRLAVEFVVAQRQRILGS